MRGGRRGRFSPDWFFVRGECACLLSLGSRSRPPTSHRKCLCCFCRKEHGCRPIRRDACASGRLQLRDHGQAASALSLQADRAGRNARGGEVGRERDRVQWNLPPKIMGSQGSGSSQVKGQAVAVDLPGGQTLFVLLRSGWNVDWAAQSPYGPYQDLPVRTGDQSPHAVERTIRTLGRQVSGYPFSCASATSATRTR